MSVFGCNSLQGSPLFGKPPVILVIAEWSKETDQHFEPIRAAWVNPVLTKSTLAIRVNCDNSPGRGRIHLAPFPLSAGGERRGTLFGVDKASHGPCRKAQLTP